MKGDGQGSNRSKLEQNCKQNYRRLCAVRVRVRVGVGRIFVVDFASVEILIG